MSGKSEKIFDFIGKWIIITGGLLASVFSFLSVFEIPVNKPAAILFAMVVTGIFLGFSKWKMLVKSKKIRWLFRCLILLMFLGLLFLLRKMLLIGICYSSDQVLHAYNEYFSDNILGFYDEGTKIVHFGRYCTVLVLVVTVVYSYILVIATADKLFASIHLLLSVLFVVPGLILGRMPDSFLVSVLMIYYLLCFMYQRNRRVYPIRMLWLVGGSLTIIGLIVLMNPPSDYDGEARYLSAKKKLNELSQKWKLDDFSMNSMKSILEGEEVEANGGVSDGKLGEVGTVRYADKLMLSVNITPDHNHVYLKGFVGTCYTGHSWEDISSDDAAKFRIMSKQYQMEYGGEKEDLEQAMFTPDYTVLERKDQLKMIRIRHNGAEETYRYVPYFNDLFREDVSYYYGFRPNSQKERVYEYEYLSLSESEMYQAVETFGQDKIDEMELPPMVESFIYETECAVPRELCDLFEQKGFERNCYDGTSESLKQCISQARSYLAQNTKYTLSPGKLEPGKDYVIDFLVNKKAGYCTAYASAGVMLLRYMGIPSRYVAGYVIKSDVFSNESFNDFTNLYYFDHASETREPEELILRPVYVQVKDSFAHAWAEIYVEGLGFVPVEMTPGYVSENMPESPAETDPATQPAINPTPPSETQPVTTTKKQETTKEPHNTKQPGETKFNGGELKKDRHTTRAVMIVFALMAVVTAGSVGGHRIVLAHRKKYDYKTDDNEYNLAVLDRIFSRWLRKKKIVWTKDKNVEELEREIFAIVRAVCERKGQKWYEPEQDRAAGDGDVADNEPNGLQTNDVQSDGIHVKGILAMRILQKRRYGNPDETFSQEEYQIVREYVEVLMKVS